jgi:hypothetical protein
MFAYSTYHRVREQIAAGEAIQIFGVTIGASPGELALALGVVGLVGICFLALGVGTLVKKRE